MPLPYMLFFFFSQTITPKYSKHGAVVMSSSNIALKRSYNYICHYTICILTMAFGLPFLVSIRDS